MTAKKEVRVLRRWRERITYIFHEHGKVAALSNVYVCLVLNGGTYAHVWRAAGTSKVQAVTISQRWQEVM